MVPRVELSMNSVNASSRQRADGNVLELDQRDFLGDIEGLQMTTPSIIHSRTDSNGIDETRGNNTLEESDLLVNEKNVDWQILTHHNHQNQLYHFHRTFSEVLILICCLTHVLFSRGQIITKPEPDCLTSQF